MTNIIPPGLCILMPTYNSSQSLIDSNRELGEVISTDFPDWKLVLVDDMSPSEKSWSTIQELYSQHSNISAVRLLKNSGRSVAAICGLNYINKHFPDSHVVIMDDDLQHRPSDVPRLVQELKQSPDIDVVIGQFKVRETSVINKFGSWLKGKLDQSYYGLPRDIRMGPFIAINSNLVPVLCGITAHSPLLGSQILQIASTYKGVECTHAKRKYGLPVFSFSKRVILFFAIAISDVTFLSKAFSLFGFTLCIFCFLLSAIFLLNYFVTGSSINGWLSLILTNLFFGGINLVGLSIVFRNIALIKNTTDRIPAWCVREQLDLCKKVKS